MLDRSENLGVKDQLYLLDAYLTPSKHLKNIYRQKFYFTFALVPTKHNESPKAHKAQP